MLQLPAILLLDTAASAQTAPTDEALLIAGGAFLAGLVVGLLCVGLFIALVRRLLSAAKRLVVLAITATMVLGVAATFALVAYSLAR